MSNIQVKIIALVSIITTIVGMMGLIANFSPVAALVAGIVGGIVAAIAVAGPNGGGIVGGITLAIVGLSAIAIGGAFGVGGAYGVAVSFAVGILGLAATFWLVIKEIDAKYDDKTS